MKTLKKIWVAAFLCISLGYGLSACYDEKADIAFFSGEQLIDQIGTCTNLISHVTLYIHEDSLCIYGDSVMNIGIAYGKGNYQALTSDVKVVKVGVQGERLILTAGGTEGNAVVTVTDDKGNQASLTVESVMAATDTIKHNRIQ